MEWTERKSNSGFGGEQEDSSKLLVLSGLDKSLNKEKRMVARRDKNRKNASPRIILGIEKAGYFVFTPCE